MGAGDVPRSDVERRRAGPPIDSRHGPMRIAAAAQARAFDTSVEMSPLRLWNAARALGRATASACSGHRPVGSPFGPS